MQARVQVISRDLIGGQLSDLNAQLDALETKEGMLSIHSNQPKLLLTEKLVEVHSGFFDIVIELDFTCVLLSLSKPCDHIAYSHGRDGFFFVLLI